jgi:hypothetical protein
LVQESPPFVHLPRSHRRVVQGALPVQRSNP